MRNRRLKDEELDNIGRGLLAAGAIRDTEIERIAAQEDLFAGVLAKLEPVRELEKTAPFNLTRFIRRHELGIGGAFAAVLCLGIFGLYLQQKSEEVVSGGKGFPAGQPGPAARFDNTPQVSVTENTAGRAATPVRDVVVDEAVSSAPAAERAVYRPSRPVVQSQPQVAAIEPSDDKEFYAVTYTGENDEAVRGGRVIRVDVSRSTLFAMGINVPLENESPTVKADLLVGPDGVTRAVRLVE